MKPKTEKKIQSLTLSTAKSRGWSELNDLIKTSALEAARIFGLTFEEFHAIAGELGLAREGRSKGGRWNLALYDMLEISYFILFFKELGYSVEESLSNVKQGVGFQKKLHSELRNYEPEIELILPKNLKAREKKSAQVRHRKAKEIIEFYRNHTKIGWGLMLRTAMIFNKELIGKNVQWSIKPRLRGIGSKGNEEEQMLAIATGRRKK